MLTSLTPNLMVDDVRRTVEWYKDTLGFSLEAEVPGAEGIAFAIMVRDSIRLMVQSTQSLTADLPVLTGVPVGASQTFYIEVSDIDDLRRQVEGKATVVKDLHETFYGTREFYFQDCNGYILSFSQESTSTSPS